MHNWNKLRPIHQQLAEEIAIQFMDGCPGEGEDIPTVHALARSYLVNPLTVERAMNALIEIGVVESRGAGAGYFVVKGARAQLRNAQRQRFLTTEWPMLSDRLRRLDIGPENLDWNGDPGP